MALSFSVGSSVAAAASTAKQSATVQYFCVLACYCSTMTVVGDSVATE